MTIGPARAVLAPLTALLVASLLAAPASAQIYKYKDASGRIVVTDKPPPGMAQRKSQPSEEPAPESDAAPQAAPAAAPDAKPATDPKLEARRKEQEAKLKAEADEKQKAYERQLKEFCDQNRRYLAALEGGQRVARFNASTGEREFLEDAQRNAEIERLRQSLGDCK